MQNPTSLLEMGYGIGSDKNNYQPDFDPTISHIQEDISDTKMRFILPLQSSCHCKSIRRQG